LAGRAPSRTRESPSEGASLRAAALVHYTTVWPGVQLAGVSISGGVYFRILGALGAFGRRATRFCPCRPQGPGLRAQGPYGLEQGWPSRNVKGSPRSLPPWALPHPPRKLRYPGSPSARSLDGRPFTQKHPSGFRGGEPGPPAPPASHVAGHKARGRSRLAEGARPLRVRAGVAIHKSERHPSGGARRSGESDLCDRAGRGPDAPRTAQSAR
jgi:hypothetical protein